jgi:hypothetical protein
VLRECSSQIIEHEAGLDAHAAPRGIDLEHAMHVLAEVDHDRAVDALAGERRAAAAPQDRHTMRAADFERGAHIVDVAWDDHAHRDLSIVRRVVRVHRT